MEISKEFLNINPGPVALKIAVGVGIGMLVGMERKWSHKEAGIRTFSIIALLGVLSAVIGQDMVIVSMVGVFLLVIGLNTRSLKVDNTLEITTSAALIVDYLLGVLVGLGDIFTPVAGAIVMTMLLAWKIELNRFAGGLKPFEIRSAILLGLIGFVIYPLMPDNYIDPWNLLNPKDAWLSVIAISGIGFVNYVFLRIFSTNGLYWGAIFGGLVNSTATVAEISGRAESSGLTSRITILCLLTNIAMFARNLLLVGIFCPAALPASLLPLIAMSLVSGFCIWLDLRQEGVVEKKVIATAAPHLDTPISLQKVLTFGVLFVFIQVGGTLLTRIFGSYGMLATGVFGGLISSASTTAAASTMASHGQISASVAGSVAILSSLASAVISLPIIWKTVKDRGPVKKFTIELVAIVIAGTAVVWLDRAFELTERFMRF